MFVRSLHKVLPAIPLLFIVSLKVAVADDTGSPPVVAPESTRRFLDNVRDYGDGRPSPNILYSTKKIGEAANSPGRTITQGPSVVSTGTPPAHKPLSGSSLQGGTIERRPNTPYPLTGGTIDRAPITPTPIKSPWQQ